MSVGWDVHRLRRGLEGGRVQVVWFSGSGTNDTGCLSADENEKASRFVAAASAAEYRAVRVTLRQLLGALLDRDPASVVFDYLASGKPVLADRGLEFNVSHSGGLAAIAVADRPVGVDVERHRDRIDPLALATRFFSPEEQAALEALAPDARLRRFFDRWAMKESLLKAVGCGFQQDPRTVTANPGSVVGPDGERWTLQPFAVDDGWSAAVAHRSRDVDVSQLREGILVEAHEPAGGRSASTARPG